MPTKENIMHNNKTNKCTYYCEYCTTKIPIMYPDKQKTKNFYYSYRYDREKKTLNFVSESERFSQRKTFFIADWIAFLIVPKVTLFKIVLKVLTYGPILLRLEIPRQTIVRNGTIDTEQARSARGMKRRARIDRNKIELWQQGEQNNDLRILQNQHEETES